MRFEAVFHLLNSLCLATCFVRTNQAIIFLKKFWMKSSPLEFALYTFFSTSGARLEGYFLSMYGP